MNELFCEEFLHYFYSISDSDLEDLRSTYIANCVFNIFLNYTAVILNIVTVYAIQKTSSLSKTLKTLLLSLAVSDISVGLFALPIYTSLLASWLQQNNPSCNVYRMVNNFGILCSMASFLGVVAVSVDRFLAVHLHLRYQELVTHKRVVVVVISIWLLSACVSLITLRSSLSTQIVFLSIGGVIGLFVTLVVYIRIYLVARRHKNEIHCLQRTPDEIAKFATLVKSAVGVFYVYLAFFVCYLPYIISLTAIEISGPSIALKKCHLFSATLVFLNSSLNPVIYCWKMRHIRHAIMDILRNMSWNRNRASHDISMR